MKPNVFSLAGLVALAGYLGSAALGQAPVRPSSSSATLLNVSGGAIPNDTGSGGLTKMSIQELDALGDKALKVDFAAGDSFGDRSSKVKNWTAFESIQFQIFNPGNSKAILEFNVKHSRTSSYQTRVVWPIELKPGKNAVAIPIGELTNVNGSSPDLAKVIRWYIACGAGETPTLYFRDIRLDGASAASPYAAGKLTTVSGDPARLTRIKATPMPKVDKVIAFDTAEADAVLSALEVFPPDNPWNLVVSDWPLHPQSREMVASIGRDKVLRANEDMCYVIVPPDQPKVAVKIAAYPGESDRGPCPVPDSLPIEGWPKWYHRDGKKPTLAEVQHRPANYEGDRHAIIVDPTGGKLYEFFVMGRTGGGWAADQISVFDLRINRLRPDGWTSADAAGLPIFPAVIRHDELQRGAVEHAMRFTIRRSRKAYVYPATHHAGHSNDEDLPRMGERFRLRQDFDTSGFSPTVRTILDGLKKYGMFVADNGIEWAISIAPDPRIPAIHEELRKVKGADFEVVQPPAGYQPPVK
ncbi:MAG: hypothetical protein ACI8XO_004881 [Verrucomicrobiales bacterium]|jgi:hypothetical protein